MGDQEAAPRKTRSDAGQPTNPGLPTKIVTHPVSMGDRTGGDGLPPLEVSMLEPADWTALGDLGLLVEILKRIEQGQPNLTLTTSLVFLKPGLTISNVPQGRRACLVAVFASPVRLCVLLDVDHSDLAGGLSGLLLRYDRLCPMAEMERHIKMLLDRMVDRYGRGIEDFLKVTPLPGGNFKLSLILPFSRILETGARENGGQSIGQVRTEMSTHLGIKNAPEATEIMTVVAMVSAPPVRPLPKPDQPRRQVAPCHHLVTQLPPFVSPRLAGLKAGLSCTVALKRQVDVRHQSSQNSKLLV